MTDKEQKETPPRDADTRKQPLGSGDEKAPPGDGRDRPPADRDRPKNSPWLGGG